MSNSHSNSNLSKPDKRTGLYIKKGIVDVGNPRYAASKASSFMGGLTTGQHVLHERKVPAHYAKEIQPAPLDQDYFGNNNITKFNTISNQDSEGVLAKVQQHRTSQELTHPDEIYYDDNEYDVFNRLRKEGSGLFLGE